MVLAIVLSFTASAGFVNTPPALQAVLADAATRSGVPQGTQRILRVEPAQWSDSGLGCPQPGEFYLQAITPGWLIEVQSGGTIFEYHTDATDRFVLCAQR